MARTHSAKEILAEALATIKASYWIKSEEVVLAPVHEDPEAWKKIKKAIDVQVSKIDNDYYETDDYFTVNGKVKVTGVCSIGAMALACNMLYDEPLVSFASLAARDKASYMAGAALAMVIQEEFAEKSGYLLHGRHEDTIASWNDSDEREKKEVIAAFKKALDSPLLSSQAAWTFKRIGLTIAAPNLVFATKKAAKDFLTTPSAMRDALSKQMPISTLEPIKIEPWK